MKLTRLHGAAKTHVKSKELFERACHSIPGGVNSHYRQAEQPHPLFFTRASGSKIVDVDGNEYIDFVFGRGPLLFGHSPDFIHEAIQNAMSKGVLFGSQHRLEVELAEQVTQLIPCAHMVRFATTGTEAVQLALRVARAYTKRSLVVKFEGQYHGWSDAMMFHSSPSGPSALSEGLPLGLDSQIVVLPWNDFDQAQRVFLERHGEIAAVITEPIMCNCNCIAPRKGFLEFLRSLCTDHNALLIFDEVITGFRIHAGGAQATTGVIPDLATFAKAMSAGFPMSMLCGRRDVMKLIGDGAVIHAGTVNANLISVVAAKATIDRICREDVIGEIRQKGCHLMDGLEELGRTYRQLGMVVQGPGPMFAVSFSRGTEITDYNSHIQRCDVRLLGEFVGGMLRHGIRLQTGLWFMSLAHTDRDIELTLSGAAKVLSKMASRFTS